MNFLFDGIFLLYDLKKKPKFLFFIKIDVTNYFSKKRKFLNKI